MCTYYYPHLTDERTVMKLGDGVTVTYLASGRIRIRTFDDSDAFVLITLPCFLEQESRTMGFHPFYCIGQKLQFVNKKKGLWNLASKIIKFLLLSPYFQVLFIYLFIYSLISPLASLQAITSLFSIFKSLFLCVSLFIL